MNTHRNQTCTTLAIVLLCAGLAACADEGRPETTIVVGTDVPNTQYDFIRARLFDERQNMLGEHMFSAGEVGAAFSFTVVAPSVDDRTLRVELELEDASGILIRRVASLQATDDRRAAYMFLASDCMNVVCGSGETCSETGCRPDFISDDELVSVREGEELANACFPGEATCGPDLESVLRCEVFGASPVSERCTGDDVCDVSAPGCVDEDGSPGGNNGSGGNNNMGGGGEKVWINLDVKGDGVGAIVSRDPDFECEAQCRFEVNRGEELELRAESESGSYFLQWTGACWGDMPQCTLIMDNEHFVEARFEPDGVVPEQSLEIIMVGSGQGRVFTGDGNLDCPAGACVATFPHGSNVTVEVAPAPGSIFTGWEGPCQGVSGNSCTLLLDYPTILQPRFEPEPTGPGRNDLDGDGFTDFVYAAPGASPGQPGSERGRVYVEFGPRGYGYAFAGDADRVFDGPGPYSEFGRAVAMDGDVNGDGYVDLLVGAPGVDNKRGAVFGINGGPGLIGSQTLSMHPNVIVGAHADERFGYALSTRADVDGDQIADVLVGAPGNGTNLGRVYVFLGANFTSGGPPAPAIVIESEQPGDGFGMAVQSAGDLDGDGRDEFLVGAPNWNSGTNARAGRAYVFRFDTQLAHAREADVIVAGNQANQMVGFAVTGLGDWQGDAAREFAVSAHGQDRVLVFSGIGAALLTPAMAQWTLQGVGFFGASLGGFEDYTGDGRPDLAVGAPIDGGIQRGSVRLFAGGGPITSPAFQVNGDCASQNICQEEGLGYSVGPGGDFDADGVLELAVGSRYGGGPAGPMDQGRILLFDVNSPSRPVNVQSSGYDWEFGAESYEHGMCAALSGSPAHPVESMLVGPR